MGLQPLSDEFNGQYLQKNAFTFVSRGVGLLLFLLLTDCQDILRRVQAQPKPRNSIYRYGEPRTLVTLFERPSEAFRSWLDLGLETENQSICWTEPDPAARDFCIGFALGHIPPLSALANELSFNKLHHPPQSPPQIAAYFALPSPHRGSYRAAAVSDEWNRSAYTCHSSVKSRV